MSVMRTFSDVQPGFAYGLERPESRTDWTRVPFWDALLTTAFPALTSPSDLFRFAIS